MWKRVFSTDVEAGYSTTGHETRDSFSVPFQYARGAIAISDMVGFGNFNG